MFSFAFSKISPSFIFLKYCASSRNYLQVNSECSTYSPRQGAIIYQGSPSDGDIFQSVFFCMCVYVGGACYLKMSVKGVCKGHHWAFVCGPDLRFDPWRPGKNIQLLKVLSRNSLWILNLCSPTWLPLATCGL